MSLHHVNTAEAAGQSPAAVMSVQTIRTGVCSPTGLRPGPARGVARNTPKGPPAPRMAGGPFGVFCVTGGQEALAFSPVFSVFCAAGFAATGAGFAAS